MIYLLLFAAWVFYLFDFEDEAVRTWAGDEGA